MGLGLYNGGEYGWVPFVAITIVLLICSLINYIIGNMSMALLFLVIVGTAWGFAIAGGMVIFAIMGIVFYFEEKARKKRWGKKS